jgi:hypothetical protein
MLGAAILIFFQPASADPSRYPQFAQQRLPESITPVLVSVDQLFSEIAAGAKPLIIDVRPAEEYHETHILGAISLPLTEFSSHLKDVPRDRPVVLY